MMYNILKMRNKWIQTDIKHLFSVLLVFIFLSKGHTEDCIPRQYPFGQVCVCNATYCDTIPKVRPPLSGNFILYTSSKGGLRFKKSLGNFESQLQATRNTYTIRKNITFQKIIGFGAAFTDATGINVLSLSEPTQELLLKSYFSFDGIEYNLGRVPIGGTDFSTRGYTYQDNKVDATLSAFNLTMEDYSYKIPLIKRAKGYSEKLILVAACWSPPAWMKSNNYLTGAGVLKEKYSEAYAKYHVKFLDEYKKEGISFWCISTGNEPSNGVSFINKINALGWTPAGLTKWIGENFGPAIQSSYPNTCILALDDQRFVYPWLLNTIMNNEKASKYINGTGVHWYWDFIIPASVLKRTHDAHPNLFILNTESSYGDKPWELNKVALGSWSRGEQYAEDIISSLNNWVTGWIDWNFALNEKGGPNWVNNFVDSPIIVNETADEFYKQPMYYALGHFSKFIPPGSVRVDGSSNPINPIQILSVKRPDNSIASVFLNKRSFDVTLTFIDEDRGTAAINIPKHSICSMIYK